MSKPDWVDRLHRNPLPWLLSDDAPLVRHLAIQWLLDARLDDPEVSAARGRAMVSEPIASILFAQDPAGFWENQDQATPASIEARSWFKLGFPFRLGP
ncbi:MAG TPA: hypothetical protein VGJ60_27650 [Chloroflexota bacterium]|jgi:hypothetical protein